MLAREQANKDFSNLVEEEIFFHRQTKSVPCRVGGNFMVDRGERYKPQELIRCRVVLRELREWSRDIPALDWLGWVAASAVVHRGVLYLNRPFRMRSVLPRRKLFRLCNSTLISYDRYYKNGRGKFFVEWPPGTASNGEAVASFFFSRWLLSYWRSKLTHLSDI